LKGRSEWNKSSIKKRYAYELLLRLGGGARWKDLEANRSKLGWGPTTLKQTLDKLVADGDVFKEARLGEKGPEVWYHAKVKGITLLLKNVMAFASIQPKQLEEWRTAAREKMMQVKITEKMSLEERIQALQEADRDYYKLLTRAYWTLHNLICKLGFPEIMADKRVYLGFTDNGDLCAIPTEILKDLIKKAGEDFLV